MLRIDYVAAARRDFDESFDWYNRRSTQAAVRFADAVDAAIVMISAQPTRFASRDGVHRECPVKTFPFRVIYRVTDSSVLIVAIAHAKRRPGFWQNRS